MEDDYNPPQERKDFSSKTIFVLVVLTLVVSFIGAWMSFSYTLGVAPQENVQSTSTAKIHFVIQEPPEPMTDSTSGMVAFEILEN